MSREEFEKYLTEKGWVKGVSTDFQFGNAPETDRININEGNGEPLIELFTALNIFDEYPDMTFISFEDFINFENNLS